MWHSVRPKHVGECYHKGVNPALHEPHLTPYVAGFRVQTHMLSSSRDWPKPQPSQAATHWPTQQKKVYITTKQLLEQQGGTSKIRPQSSVVFDIHAVETSRAKRKKTKEKVPECKTKTQSQSLNGPLKAPSTVSIGHHGGEGVMRQRCKVFLQLAVCSLPEGFLEDWNGCTQFLKTLMAASHVTIRVKSTQTHDLSVSPTRLLLSPLTSNCKLTYGLQPLEARLPSDHLSPSLFRRNLIQDLRGWLPGPRKRPDSSQPSKF